MITERAPKLSVTESVFTDRHERGRVREVEARERRPPAPSPTPREPRVGEGPGADGLHGRAHLERACEAWVAVQEVIRNIRHGRVNELPARAVARSDDDIDVVPRGTGSTSSQHDADGARFQTCFTS